MTDVAHGKLGVTLGLGQEQLQWCWLARRHNSDCCVSVRSGQAHLAKRCELPVLYHCMNTVGHWMLSGSWAPGRRAGAAWRRKPPHSGPVWHPDRSRHAGSRWVT